MKTFLVGLLILAALTACKKDKDNPPPPDPVPQDTLLNWKRVIPGVPGGYADVWFTTKQQGFLLANGIFRTTDEGKNWTRAGDGVFANLFFLDAQYGFAQGSDFGYTTNGGANWTVRANPVQTFTDLYFSTPSTGYFTSPNGLYKTIDTGKTWQKTQDGNCNGIFFFNPANGWINIGGKFYKTTNGGSSWQFVWDLQTGNVPEIAVIQFTDAMHGKYSGEKNFAKSDDGGNTWTKQQFAYRIRDIHFVSNDIGYLLAPPEIFKTTDGGNTWVRSARIGANLVELYFADANNGWACGFDDYLFQLKQ